MNFYEERDGFGVSYNPDVWADPIARVIDEMFGGKGGAETALIKDGSYYILEGNWTEQYKGKTFDECYTIFLENEEHKAPTSD